MDAAEEELKKFLLAKQEELINRLERLKTESSRANNPISPDFEEQAVEREGEEVIEEVKRVAATELHDIKIAIERLEAGTYGVCGECGDPIPVARLKILPMAMYCTDCQDYVDQTHR